MILKQGHTYRAMPHDGKLIAYIYRGGRCYYHDGPYSLAATQALRAAFPQYWTAIRDYGYAHPQLVPFINEDPMLIVSLVEVGKTRWLVGDGKAWIEVDSPITTDDYLKWIEDNKETSSSFQPIFATAPTYTYAHWINNTKGVFAIGGQESSQFDLSQGVHIVEKKADKWFLDGVQKQQRTMEYTKYDSFKLFDWYGSPSRASNSALQLFQIGESPTMLLVPCQHQGEAGMLDVVTATFHPNANTEGAFTIEITDKE